MTGHHDCPRLPMPCSKTTGGASRCGNSVMRSGTPSASIVRSIATAAGALIMVDSLLIAAMSHVQSNPAHTLPIFHAIHHPLVIVELHSATVGDRAGQNRRGHSVRQSVAHSGN